MEKKNKIILSIIIFLALILAAILLLALHFTLFESIRFVLACVFVLFLPGFVWSFILARNNAEADAKNAETVAKLGIVDRIILSFGLSFVLSPLTVFLLSRIGIKITFFNSLIEIFGIIMIGLIIIFVQKFILKHKNV